MDNIHITSSKPIDSIVVSNNLIKCVEGYELVEAREILINNYRSYIIDLNLERYFNEQMSVWDTIDKQILDPVR